MTPTTNALDKDRALLVGRERERARIDGLLQAGRSGRSAALLIRGEPGIGKSALVDYARRSAAGMVLLEARGVESEAELPFAALSQLLAPVRDRVRAIP